MENIAGLKKYFRVEDKRPEREYLIVSCRACGTRWSIRPNSKEMDIGPNNAVLLLAHAAKHRSGA